MEGARVPSCEVENYDQFLRKKEVPCGVYVFTDMERLTPWELRVAGRLTERWRQTGDAGH